jgi:hypothetical protein
MSRRLAPALAAGALCVSLLALLPNAAGAATFRTTISGKQELTWKLDGTTGSCEIRHGVGTGTVKFSFKSSKSSLIAVAGGNTVGSINTVAKGSISGSFTDTVETPCPGFAPLDPYMDSTAGCGATHYGIRVDISRHGAFVYVTGPEVPLGPVSIAQSGNDCPFPDGGYSWSTSGDRTACGDGKQVWQRSWGVGGPTGLFATRLHVTQKGLLHVKKGKTKLLTGHKVVDCTTDSQYSGDIRMTGTLTYTLSMKRVF